MSTDRTVDALEADGFTHIEARCRCGQVAAIPFRLLRERRAIADPLPFAQLTARLRCSRCGEPPAEARPWNVGMASPQIHPFGSPAA